MQDVHAPLLDFKPPAVVQTQPKLRKRLLKSKLSEGSSTFKIIAVPKIVECHRAQSKQKLSKWP